MPLQQTEIGARSPLSDKVVLRTLGVATEALRMYRYIVVLKRDLWIFGENDKIMMSKLSGIQYKLFCGMLIFDM